MSEWVLFHLTSDTTDTTTVRIIHGFAEMTLRGPQLGDGLKGEIAELMVEMQSKQRQIDRLTEEANNLRDRINYARAALKHMKEKHIINGDTFSTGQTSKVGGGTAHG